MNGEYCIEMIHPLNHRDNLKYNPYFLDVISMGMNGENDSRVKHTILPSILSRGPRAIDEIGRSIGFLGTFHAGLVICDEITYGIAGQRIEEILSDDGKNISIYQISDATEEVLDEAIGIIAENDIGIVLGVGGGKPIDIAKKSSYDSGIPFVSVPTAPSHDGIGSARASIKNENGVVSLAAQPPAIIVADTTILSNAPYRLLASGCGDVISNITAVRDWEIARDEMNEEFSEYSAELSLLSSRLLLKHASDIRTKTEASIRIVINGLITSGIAMAIVNSSRPASGAEHKFSHALDRIAAHPALHGEQCALGSIVTAYLQGGDWEMLRDVMKTIGIPITAAGLGLESDDVIRALVEAKDIRPERYTVLRSGLDHERAAYSLSAVGIID